MDTKNVRATALVRWFDRSTGSRDSFLASNSRELADSRLTSEVEHALRAAGCLDFLELQISVDDGRIILRGRVRTYYLKQLAQATAISVAGIQGVDNEIDVD